MVEYLWNMKGSVLAYVTTDVKTAKAPAKCMRNFITVLSTTKASISDLGKKVYVYRLASILTEARKFSAL